MHLSIIKARPARSVPETFIIWLLWLKLMIYVWSSFDFPPVLLGFWKNSVFILTLSIFFSFLMMQTQFTFPECSDVAVWLMPQ